MATQREVLIPDVYYHVFNRAVGNDNLFKNDKNYIYFIELCEEKMIACVDIISYCLMPNHFHFLVKVKPKGELCKLFEVDESIVENDLATLISRKIGNVFNSYAQGFNKENKRRGSLFIDRFKRNLVTSDDYLRNLILYIHHNPKSAGLVKKLEDWNYSSYKYIISDLPSMVKKEEAILPFEDLENFIFVHRGKPKSLDDF